MTKFIRLFILGIMIVSCKGGLSEEELILHEQNLQNGIEKRKADLDKALTSLQSQADLINQEYQDVNSFKIGRSSSTKERQIAEVERKAEQLKNLRKRIHQLKNNLDYTTTEFPYHYDPKSVVEKIFYSAKSKDLSILMWLVDPYAEYDSEVGAIGTIVAQPIEVQTQFIDNFQNGMTIGEPTITDKVAKVDFRFGPNGSQNETMILVKRNNGWYLSSF